MSQRSSSTSATRRGSHTLIANSELLIWTATIPTAEHLPKKDADLRNCAWLMYGCRFRKGGRQLVRDVLNENGLSVRQQHILSDAFVSDIDRMIQRCSALMSNNKQCCKLTAESSRKRRFSTKASLHDSDKRMSQRCTHVCSRRRFGSYSRADFVRCCGVYTPFSEFLLVK